MKLARIVGVAAAVGFIGYVSYSLLQNEPMKVLHPHLQRTAGGGYVAGAIRNSGEADQSVSLEIRYYDRGGRSIGTDTVALDHVGSGATREFAAPPRNLPPDASYSIYLNHGRNPYGN